MLRVRSVWACPFFFDFRLERRGCEERSGGFVSSFPAAFFSGRSVFSTGLSPERISGESGLLFGSPVFRVGEGRSVSDSELRRGVSGPVTRRTIPVETILGRNAAEGSCRSAGSSGPCRVRSRLRTIGIAVTSFFLPCKRLSEGVRRKKVPGAQRRTGERRRGYDMKKERPTYQSVVLFSCVSECCRYSSVAE